MQDKKIFKNVLVSVSDKSQLETFIPSLAQSGARVVSTGGTAKFLENAGVKVIHVSEQTGFPEVMDGRVRTLHPHIHIPLLARKHEQGDVKLLEEMGLDNFDLVVCNLYPFEEALSEGLNDRELCEYIDIGGPTLLRAAAKNFETTTVVVDPSDYALVLEGRASDLEFRKRLATKVFYHTSSYDSMIAKRMSAGEVQKNHSLGGQFVQEMRYGENPQQKAVWYRIRGTSGGIHQAEILQGKELSYNNLLDVDAGVQALRLFERPTVVSLKHNNPCGIASSDSLIQATKESLKADPVSVFGGIVALNRPVTGEVAKVLTELFLECVIAPDFDSGSLDIFSKKKNLRVLKWPQVCENKSKQEQIRTVDGGYLVQSSDTVSVWSEEWNVQGKPPTEELVRSMSFIWRVVARLKSNAIAIGSGEKTLGLGMGQVNRIDAVKQAVERWKAFHPNETKDIVLASDAFFPFPDSIEQAHEAGISWIIQPGGSIKDKEVIQKAQDLGVNLVLTKRRHFLH